MNNPRPDYKRIYSDIIDTKYPERKEEYRSLLAKSELSVLDIIELNDKIFGKGNKSTGMSSQKYRSYNKSAIFEILNYQKQNKLNNSQLANHFQLSRNTVTKWKKLFYSL